MLAISGSSSDLKSIKSSVIAGCLLGLLLGLPDLQALGVVLSFIGHVKGD